MKESAQAALSYARSRTIQFSPEERFFKNSMIFIYICLPEPFPKMELQPALLMERRTKQPVERRRQKKTYTKAERSFLIAI